MKTDISVLDSSWLELNDVLRGADEQTCQDLLKAELKGRKRQQVALRIWSRFNRARGQREKLELKAKVMAAAAAKKEARA